MRVGIIGASGYTGGELLRILASHPKCEIACATSRTLDGKSVGAVHPNLRGMLDLKFEDLRTEEVISRSDFVFTATPHGSSMKIVPALMENGIRAVDLSGDFRFKDVAIYEKYYNMKHEHPEIKAVYGLPELHRKEIKKANLVANPGCYPVSLVLGLAPALKHDIIENDRIAADSKSGVSGAGAQASAKTHYPDAADSVLPYSPASHRHMPEIEGELGGIKKGTKISFVPHLVPVIRGISSTMHCFLKAQIDGSVVRERYAEFYKGEPFVRVLDANEMPTLNAVRGSNYIDIGCFAVDKERERLIIVSTIDNLVKGASGNAVQNMNIMVGFDESAGLMGAGLRP